jgi:ribonuclease P protein component
LNGRPQGRLSPADRIRARREFQRAQREGLKVVAEHFVFLVSRSPQPTSVRLGVTASRRVGGSVQRNRAKRLVREAFRATRDLWSPGLDVVVIVRGPLGDLGLEATTQEWRAAAVPLRRRQRQLEGTTASPPSTPPEARGS